MPTPPQAPNMTPAQQRRNERLELQNNALQEKHAGAKHLLVEARAKLVLLAGTEDLVARIDAALS